MNKEPRFPNTFQGKVVETGAPDLQVLHGFLLGEQHAGLVTLSTYDGRRALDVRRFYFDEARDQWRPSVKGLRIPPKHAAQIAMALYKFVDREDPQ